MFQQLTVINYLRCAWFSRFTERVFGRKWPTCLWEFARTSSVLGTDTEVIVESLHKIFKSLACRTNSIPIHFRPPIKCIQNMNYNSRKDITYKLEAMSTIYVICRPRCTEILGADWNSKNPTNLQLHCDPNAAMTSVNKIVERSPPSRESSGSLDIIAGDRGAAVAIGFLPSQLTWVIRHTFDLQVHWRAWRV